MKPVGTIAALVMDCADAPALASFWSEVLGAEVTESDAGWASVQTPAHGRMSFQSVEGYEAPAWPGGTGAQQMHLDVLVDDLAAATDRVLTVGAAALTDVLDAGPKAWRVFADPAGHPFCLVSVPE